MIAPDQPRKRSGFFRILVVILTLIIVACVVIDQETRPVVISGPMVQIPEPQGLTFVWQMQAFFPRGAVELQTPDGVRLVESAQRTSEDRYEASFRSLLPGTEYHYTVLNYAFLGHEISVAGPFEAVVPPPRGRPFRFLAFGDSGTGGNAQADLAEEMARHNPDLIIHAGDLDQSNGDLQNYIPHFFEPYTALIRSVPFMPVLGNHDCATDNGRPFVSMLVLPRNGPADVEPERNYWFDYGDARFVGLDSNRVAEKQGGVLTAEQMKTVVAPWLREVLTHCDARWKFVYFHQPFYTGSAHPASGSAYLKEAYATVFDECGVDMVFSGHNHLYERTAPIRGDQIVGDGQGVVYITTGAGGARRYPEDQPPPEYIRAYDDRSLSFTQVDLAGGLLELKQIDERGRVLDEYVLRKPGDTSSAPADACGRAFDADHSLVAGRRSVER